MSPRGGYQSPSNPAPASGPGALSKRTDGGPADKQANRVPNVTDPESSLQVGDRQMLQAAQGIAPLPQAQSPRVASPSRRNPSSAVEGAGALPSGFFDSESARPMEPVTAGMDMGAGPGSEGLAMNPMDDIRESVLNYLATNYANADALKALDEIRGTGVGLPNAGTLAPPPDQGMAPVSPDDGGMDDFDSLADSGDLLAPSLDGDSLEEGAQDVDDELAAEADESDEEPLEDEEGTPAPQPEVIPKETAPEEGAE
jgi:hypothetical protein